MLGADIHHDDSQPIRFINTQSMESAMKQVNTGGLSFQDIRDGDKYYVDKSLLIKDMLDTDDRGVFLYTRPRRFGKTTNLTMLDAFFNLEYEGNTWFNDLAISGFPCYEKYKSKYPVVLLNLKELNSDSEEDLWDSICGAALDAMGPFTELLESGRMSKSEASSYGRLVGRSATKDEISRSILMLCKILSREFGRNVVVLIDEYDRVIANRFGSDVQTFVIDILSRFLSAILKDNRSLQMAYVTGITQVAKASIFSGLNNLSVNNVFSVKSDERFGFTEAEVRGLLSYYGHPENFDEARVWYDGYRFGNAEVYNPFSLMMYIQNEFRPDSYWNNSGRNTPMVWMLQRAGSIGLDTVAELINGHHAEVRLHPSMTYEELKMSNSEDLFSLMAMTGYLNAVPRDGDIYEISIPNREVIGIVDSLLGMNRRVGGEVFSRFNTAVLDGDVEAMEGALQSVLVDGSYFSLKDESSYENIILTMMHGILRGYRVTSQKESGNGRVDLILEPRCEGTVPIIMELKVSESEGSLEDDAAGAIGQIHDRRYYLGMKGDVILIGLAFCGKEVRGQVETISS